MRVRKGTIYVYDPVMLDIIDARHDQKGEQVRVVHCHGCPPALCNSLHKPEKKKK